ncbi:cell division protein FtsQ/DivIB [Pelagibacterium luteolum]|uniref:Cell division protein FtsQ n=1 Tax=Pelagibacterium luteolum TaxID=440168 RepID=A0A1G7UWL2_9HYPH|nr:cell division protein FtsQ/DivIB [Pelagibacterium luteolum]SDG51529.1 cell division protein FtsQ [Pelagibacterium luteolum]
MQQVRRLEAFEAAPSGTALPKSPPAPLIQRADIRPISNVVPISRDRSMTLGRPFPVPVRKRGGKLVTLGNLWVLHRKLVVRVMALVIAVLVAGGLYIFREDVGEAAAVVGEFAGDQMAVAGFSIQSIEIDGLKLTRETDVARALGIAAGDVSLGYDVEAARLRVEEIPSIETATIRKIYPDRLVVSITEREPMARWRIDGATMLIDGSGSPIAPASIDDGELILVIGEGAGDDALPMINLVQRYPDLSFDLAALNRVGDRRWDLIFYSGLRVLLPETGVVDALSRLNDYQLEYQLLNRDLDLIDMRVAQYVAVRPTVREEEDDSQ